MCHTSTEWLVHQGIVDVLLQLLTFTVITILFCPMLLLRFFSCLLYLFVKLTSFLVITNLPNGYWNAVIVALFSTKQLIIHFTFRYVLRFILLLSSCLLKWLVNWLHSVTHRNIMGWIWVGSLLDPDPFFFSFTQTLES